MSDFGIQMLVSGLQLVWCAYDDLITILNLIVDFGLQIQA